MSLSGQPSLREVAIERTRELRSPQPERPGLRGPYVERGKPLLFLPQHIYRKDGESARDWNAFGKWDPETRTLQALGRRECNPLPVGGDQDFPGLPFEYPCGFPGTAVREAVDSPQALIRNIHFETDRSAKTGVPAAVAQLPEKLTLQTLKFCPHLLSRLRRYADPTSKGIRPHQDKPSMGHFFKQVYGVPFDEAKHRGLTTLGGPEGYNNSGVRKTFEYPSSTAQYCAISRLSGWCITHRHQVAAFVESETAVQDEVRKQLLDPLSYILQARYGNQATAKSLGVTGHYPRERDLLNQKIIVFPRFGRVTGKSLENPKDMEIDAQKAGYADFILFNEDGTCGISVMEVKSFWASAYTDKVLKDVYDQTARAPTEEGRFRWEFPCPTTDFIKQLWGQITFAKQYWGFATNGSKVIVYVKTGDQELTLGPSLDWTSKDLYPTLAGLCFAAIDHKLRGDGLIQYICTGSINLGTADVVDVDQDAEDRATSVARDQATGGRGSDEVEVPGDANAEAQAVKAALDREVWDEAYYRDSDDDEDGNGEAQAADNEPSEE